MKVKCPYCNEEILNDPFDGDEEIVIEDAHAYCTEHYVCQECGRWFTVCFDYRLTLENISYRKREQ